MKKSILTFLQFLLFLLVFAVGSFLRPLRLHWDLASTDARVHRTFVPDGLLLMLGLFVLILLVEAFAKRLRTAAPLTTLAVLLAGGLGLAMKFGFITRDLY